MIHKQVINHRQIAWLIGSVLITGALFSQPKTLAQIAKNDAWFAFILPTFYAILVALVFARLSRAYPGKNLFEIIFLAGGRWIGGFVNALVLFYLWLLLVADIKGVSLFLQVMLLPRTPLEIILLVFVLMLVYYGRTSTEVAARVNEMYFPVFFLITIMLYFTLSNEYAVERLEPVLESNIAAVGLGNLLPSGVFGSIFLFGAFLHAISHPRLLYSAMKHGAIIAGFSLTLLMVVQLGVMGYLITSRLTFPVYALVQQIHITDFLDRVEVIVFSIWFPAFTIKAVVTYIAFLVGVGSFAGQQHYAASNGPCGLFIVVSSLLSFPNTDDVLRFFSYGIPAITLIFQLPLLAFLFAVALLRERGSGRDSHSAHTREYRRCQIWAWINKLALGVCLVSIVGGALLENQYRVAGLISGVAYFLSFLVALVSSYLEMQAVNHLKHKQSQGNDTASADH
jgi:spore germination protein KB